MQYADVPLREGMRLISVAQEMDLLLKQGITPHWAVFKETFNWAKMRKTMPIADQIEFEATWEKVFEDVVKVKL